MTNSKFINIDPAEIHRLIAFVNEERMQEIALERFGRRLSDVELNRTAQAFWDDEGAWLSLEEACVQAVDYALDQGADWQETDGHFLKQVG